MAEILKGAPVAAAMTEKIKARSDALRTAGIVPTLAIFRVGERGEDISYERGAMKRAEKAGIAVRNVVLPADVDNETFFKTLYALNEDPGIHGILMFRPLPKHLDRERARKELAPEKDVDGCTDGSLAGVFTNSPVGFPPCTAEAAMEILHYYNIAIEGKKAAVIGRSLVIGRPVAMLLMHENATITICHRKTADVPAVAREADIVVAAAGEMQIVGKEYLRAGQTVIDVGINWSEELQKLCGDVNFEEAEELVSAITPVPGGVGSVTTAVLCRHVVLAAERSLS